LHKISSQIKKKTRKKHNKNNEEAGLLLLFQLVAAAALMTLTSLAMAGPQGPPPGRNYSPRFLPLSPQGYVPIITQNFDLNPIDSSYNFK